MQKGQPIVRANVETVGVSHDVVEHVSQIGHVVEQVPRDRLSKIGVEFVRKILTINQSRLLRLQEELL